MLTYSELRYIDPQPLPERFCIVGMPIGSRCKRIERMIDGWRVWIATHDFILGTWLELYDDGRVTHNTIRDNEGDEFFDVRPSDEEIRRKL